MALRVKIITRPKDNAFLSKYLSGVLIEFERKTIIQCISLETIEIIVINENRININCEFIILSLQKSYIYFQKIKFCASLFRVVFIPINATVTMVS